MRRSAFVLVLLALFALRGGAATFVVDDARTDGDVTPGDGACKTANATCTLPAAIGEADALPGVDAVVVPAGFWRLPAPRSASGPRRSPRTR